MSFYFLEATILYHKTKGMCSNQHQSDVSWNSFNITNNIHSPLFSLLHCGPIAVLGGSMVFIVDDGEKEP